MGVGTKHDVDAGLAVAPADRLPAVVGQACTISEGPRWTQATASPLPDAAIKRGAICTKSPQPVENGFLGQATRISSCCLRC